MKSTGMTARSAGTSACEDNISQIKDLKQNESHVQNVDPCVTLPKFVEVLSYRERLDRWSIALDWNAFLVYQELRKVPLDEVSQCSAFLMLQVAPQRISTRAVDFDLREHVELDTVFLGDGRLDLLVSTRLLATKLVAWKTQDP